MNRETEVFSNSHPAKSAPTGAGCPAVRSFPTVLFWLLASLILPNWSARAANWTGLQPYWTKNEGDSKTPPPAGGGGGWTKVPPPAVAGPPPALMIQMIPNERIWFAFRNTYDKTKSKEIKIHIQTVDPKNTLAQLSPSGNPAMVGVDPDGKIVRQNQSKNSDSGANGSGPRVLQYHFDQQPAAERIEFKNSSTNAIVIDTITAESLCGILTLAAN